MFVSVGLWLYRSHFASSNPEEITERINSIVQNQQKAAREIIAETKKEIAKNPDGKPFNGSTYLTQRIRESESLSLLVYYKSELVFWTDNLVPFEPADYSKSKSILKLNNGWYLAEEDHGIQSYQIFCLVRIKQEFLNHNRYLQNSFPASFHLPEATEVTEVQTAGGIAISDEQGKFLFSLIPDENGFVSKSFLFYTSLILLVGIILLIWFIKQECVNLERNIGSFYASLWFVLTLFILRYWSLVMEFPAVFYELDLFKPSLFAASFFLPSLGDFLINALILLYAFYFLDSRVKTFLFRLQDQVTIKSIIVGILFSFIFFYAWYIGHLLKMLIEDSNIEFNINNIFNLSVYSFIGFTIIGLLFFSFYLITEFTFRVAVQLQMSKRTLLILILLIGSASVFIQHVLGIRDLIMVLWPFAVLVVLYISNYERKEVMNFNLIVVLLISFSAFSAHALSKFTSAKEIRNRIVLAEKLATDEDPIVEIAYSDLESKLLKSDLLNNAFDSSDVFSKTEFEEQLGNQFFTGDWNNFDIQFYIFSADSTPLGLEGFAPVREFAELDNIIQAHGIPSKYNGNMFFIYNSVNKLSYVIKLPVSLRNEDPKGYLFCELRSKKIPEDIGFPELLMDKNSNKIDFIHQYSYARYVDSVQVNRFGSYRYSLLSTPYEDFEGKFTLKQDNGFDHLLYRVDDRRMLILSKPLDKVINQATTFSYLFTLFCLILIIAFTVRQVSLGYTTINMSLQGKVQFLLVGVLLISLVLFGLGTRYFIADQYQEKNNNIISEKIQSVSIEVLHKLGREKELNEELKNYIGYILGKFSGVFLSDINLYGADGKLIATSRPKIFQSGLLSTQMNPTAYVQMRQENKSEFIQQEQIGNMHYLSAYVPLLNDSNQLLGYLNLPYFARQSALETELSSFLVAILNIFVVLFALSILAALFVSNWITKPLRLVQLSLANIQLGRSNKPIQYKGKDEIGSLVEEYNKKVAELEKYAEELAKSERESAWREMAKQVAHEIKNPLTPMRLHIQHMQRSLRPDDKDWEEKLNKFSTTIIEQIDALTHIANEFSHFAKMPKAAEDVLDLIIVLQNTVELYSETPGIRIRLNTTGIPQAFVFADKDQLLRVFNNLIKNAMQAIPDSREGKIEVNLKKKGSMFQVEIRDNGTGIAADRIDKIFMPNFTTKSTGMGLGLAMVKNIVENSGGKIWFETVANSGTTFFVLLPEHQSH